MGSQWPTMGKTLMKIPLFAQSIQKSHQTLKPKGVDLIRIITSNDPKTFDNILNSFVGIASIQVWKFKIIFQIKYRLIFKNFGNFFRKIKKRNLKLHFYGQVEAYRAQRKTVILVCKFLFRIWILFFYLHIFTDKKSSDVIILPWFLKFLLLSHFCFVFLPTALASLHPGIMTNLDSIFLFTYFYW